ncbi:unnamed protein product [Gongylonema pulchrum]|uniref:Glutathione S-transferase n=1 Tax=Gongylonema pulchrum TaxID=637853 RepID=A0A183DP99_9BILA|nr:unnamed protein product [Gongylonema pulchrum]
MFDLKTDAGLASFDEHLKDFPYATGYTPSGEDVALFRHFGSAPNAKYANISRWFRNIGSYGDNERKG